MRADSTRRRSFSASAGRIAVGVIMACPTSDAPSSRDRIASWPEPMHLNVNANANPVSLVLNHLRLESQLLFFAWVPKFSQNVDAREKHLCLADSEPKVTVKAMHRASILQHFNNRTAVQVAFFERKSRIIGSTSLSSLAMGTVRFQHARVFRTALLHWHRGTDRSTLFLIPQNCFCFSDQPHQWTFVGRCPPCQLIRAG